MWRWRTCRDSFPSVFIRGTCARRPTTATGCGAAAAQTRARATMLRTALTEQYSALAGALAQLAGRLGQAGLPDPRREARVVQLFGELGLDALECSVSSDLAGRLSVSVTIARTRLPRRR